MYSTAKFCGRDSEDVLAPGEFAESNDISRPFPPPPPYKELAEFVAAMAPVPDHVPRILPEVVPVICCIASL
jgi:hypothetical protein